MTTNATEDVTLLDEGLATESVDLNIDDFADEGGGGAWPTGWYRAETIEGYQTRKGKVIQTENSTSKTGDSYNVRICFRVTSGSEERNMNESFNYRAMDFSPERMAHIKELRTDLKDVKSWPDKDAQRTSLALAKLSGFTKALGLSVKLTGQGTVIPAVFVGQKVDVYLKVDENGFNVVKYFAKAGTKTGR